MSDTTSTTENVAVVAKEISKFVVKSAAQTAVEMTAAIVLLAAVGATINFVQARRNKKPTLAVVEN